MRKRLRELTTRIDLSRLATRSITANTVRAGRRRLRNEVSGAEHSCVPSVAHAEPEQQERAYAGVPAEPIELAAHGTGAGVNAAEHEIHRRCTGPGSLGPAVDSRQIDHNQKRVLQVRCNLRIQHGQQPLHRSLGSHHAQLSDPRPLAETSPVHKELQLQQEVLMERSVQLQVVARRTARTLSTTP